MAEESLKIKVGADVASAQKALKDLGDSAETNLGKRVPKAAKETGKAITSIPAIDTKALDASIEKLVQSIGHFSKSIGGAEKTIIQFAGAAHSAAQKMGSVPPAIQKTTKEVTALTPAVQKASKAIATLPNHTGRANQALMNFGRVAQDAPFGLIGIANNIDPLLSSFQALKKETGSTGSALKALGAGLLGPAGLAIGISAISSLAIVAIQKYGSLGEAFRVLTGQTKALTEEQKKYQEEQTKAAVSIEKQKIELDSLVKIAKGDVGTKEQQSAALEKLNKLIPDNIGVLTKQNIVTQQGAEIIRAYTQALVDQAEAELLIQRAAELRVKLREKEKTLNKDLTNEVRKAGKAQAQIAAGASVSGALSGVSVVGSTAAADEKAIINASQAFKDYIADYKELASLGSRIDELTAGSVVLDTKDVKEKVVKAKKEIEDALKAANVTLPIGTVTLPTSGLEIATGQAKTIFDQLNLKKANTELALTGAKEGSVNVDNLAKSMTGLGKQIKYNVDLVEAFGSLFQSSFEAALISGRNFFESFIDGLKKLIARMLAAIAVAAILNAVTGGKAGSFMSLFSKFSGLNMSGGSAPAAPSSVGGTPSVAAGGMFGDSVQFEIQGQKLVGVLNRVNNSNRING
jgi:hypothetical protein